MKQILLFGAGKSATVLISYLIANAENENWHITIVDAAVALVETKTGNATCTTAVAANVQNEVKRKQLIAGADIVISLLPPALHILVATDCVKGRKNLLTASYADDAMRALNEEAKQNGVVLLCEMGLDPGIDHMSAMQIIDEIKEAGGRITSFFSHCGGLVAPGSDNNPWHYKISWNPRNVVMAGKGGATYKLNGETATETYEEVFGEFRLLYGENVGEWCWYPNRDSLPYLSLYGIEDCTNFVRTTIRRLEFMQGWRNLIALHLTREDVYYETDGMSIAAFLQQHFMNHDFAQWITDKLNAQFSIVNDSLDKAIQLINIQLEMQEQKIEDNEPEVPDDTILMVDDNGNLMGVNLQEEKENAARNAVTKLHESNMMLQQLYYLGANDDKTFIDKGRCSAAEVLQFILEKKLPLLPEDKDLVLMVHEITYENKQGKFNKRAVLRLEGEDGIHTAMAKTVGLPLGIAARLILNGKIAITGLHIPVSKEIYQPVLRELAAAGIEFQETDEKQ